MEDINLPFCMHLQVVLYSDYVPVVSSVIGVVVSGVLRLYLINCAIMCRLVMFFLIM